MRFPEFDGEWGKKTLGEITINFSTRNKDKVNYPMYSVTNNKGFIPQSEQFEERNMQGQDIMSYKIVNKGDFAYNPARINVGSIAKYNGSETCMISSLYVCFKTTKEVDSTWLEHLLKSPKMNFYYNVNGEGGVRVYLFYPNFARIRTSIPSLTEQKKIAKFLSLLDQRIELQKSAIEKLKSLMAGIVEELYSYTPNGIVGEYIEQVSERNKSEKGFAVYSVSNRYGFISQEDQFEDRIVASENTSNYKVVSKNMFAYNPARINVGSIARLKEDIQVIISPMYVCFRTNNGLLPEYMEYFFKTKRFNFEMNNRLEGSVRLCLSFDGLCEIPIFIPSYEAQKGVVAKLIALDKKIEIEKQIENQYQQEKQYLLSKMFI